MTDDELRTDIEFIRGQIPDFHNRTDTHAHAEWLCRRLGEALDALAATRAKLAAAEALERKLREALDWYATSTSGALWQDCGCKARAALAAPSADAGTEPPAEPSATGAGTDEPKEKA